MKYHFHLDTLFATVFLFLILWLLSITIKTSILEPGKMEPYDFDYSDVIYSQAGPNKTRFDPNIVIVNAGDTSRAGIAAILQKVNAMHPAAIGMDLLFRTRKYPDEDSMLSATVSAIPNLVMCTDVRPGEEKIVGYFSPCSKHTGFANFYGEKGNVIRYCKPFYKGDSSFAAVILHIANPDAFKRLLGRDKDLLAINYTRHDTEYFVIDYRSLLNGNIDGNALKNKIVLIGFYSNNEYNIEDKHITPMNPVFIGRSLPDMHGVVIHANIISMMLNGNYIHLANNCINRLLAIILGWFCTGIFIKYLVNNHTWFHIIARIWQSVAIIVLVALNILLFKYCRIKIDLTLAIVVLVFSADLLYVYKILAVWLAYRFNYKTIFKQH